MPAADEVEVVLLKKARDDVGAEGKRDPAVVFAPPAYVFVWVGPGRRGQKPRQMKVGLHTRAGQREDLV